MNHKISNVCINPIKSKCVDYEGRLGTNTLITEPCPNQEQVSEDLYTITENIENSSNTEGLGQLCITYPLTDGKITLSTVNSVNESEICDLKSRVSILENNNFSTLDITSFGLDFKCLVDPCGDPITELGQLLQIIIDETCNT